MRFVFVYLLLLLSVLAHGQPVENMPEDTATVMQLLDSANRHDFSMAGSGLLFSQKALEISRKLNFKRGELEALSTLGETYNFLGDFPRSLKFQFEALKISRETGDEASAGIAMGDIGIVYIQLGEYREALQNLISSKEIGERLGDITTATFALSNIGDAYDFLKMPDSALFYQRQAYSYFPQLTRTHLKSFVLRHIGNIYAELKKTDSALMFYHAAIQNCQVSNDKLNLSMVQTRVSLLYHSIQRADSSIYYAHEALANAQNARLKPEILDAASSLVSIYRKAGNYDSAFFYTDMSAAVRDSLYGAEKVRQLQLLMLQEQQRQQDILQREEQLRNRIKYLLLLSTLFVFLLLAYFLFRNNRQKQKTNQSLQEQKTKVEQAFSELKSTQAQLVQREKMASLGELTAGIAHEIQNPLNFVNNFSEINAELIDDMQSQMEKGNLADAREISNDIKENEKKIIHHGKRADAIVKGMLLHSRTSTGIKEPTNINAMADEWLRLSFHGFKAKEKSFDPEIRTDFDPAAGSIDIIPQDIGRVLQNLYNNAFYAVFEKSQAAGAGYLPTVSVRTKRNTDAIEIGVKDNGNGISSKIVDKIFQPFFTTKPTGEGTGLGLSLSYDIVKAHGGEIKVETKEGLGTEFTIQLPQR